MEATGNGPIDAFVQNLLHQDGIDVEGSTSGTRSKRVPRAARHEGRLYRRYVKWTKSTAGPSSGGHQPDEHHAILPPHKAVMIGEYSRRFALIDD